MAKYIARVELHAASYSDYETLHVAMQQHGYARIIRSDDGGSYQLPTGTYVSDISMASISIALQAATSAATATGKNSSSIVADWNSAQWQGLALVTTVRRP